MWIVLFALTGCDVCGAEFSSKCHRTKVKNTCVDPGSDEFKNSSGVNYGNFIRSNEMAIDDLVAGEGDGWCVQAHSIPCPSGSVVIASRMQFDIRVRAYSPETGQTAGYLTFRDHDMNQKCPVIWVGDEADLECALEGLQRLRDDHEQCGYSRPDVDAGPTCDLERCAGDIYP